MSVLLATCAELPSGDDDGAVLISALADVGLQGAWAVWDDPRVAWNDAAVVVVRSTWDYVPRREAFMAWANTVAEETVLANRPDVLRWNTDKRYLLELSRCGVPIVETQLIEPGEAVSLPRNTELVVKPAISAGAKHTGRYGPEQRERAASHARRLLEAGRSVLVQPYQSSVDAQGETALLFFGGHFSHAIRKGPLLERGREDTPGLFAVEQITAWQATTSERECAEATLDALPMTRSDLLYARIDVVAGDDGRTQVLEVELAEPSVFLGHSEGAAQRFARAIAAWTS